MKSLLIIGAGGYGQVVKEIAELNDYEKIDFLDDNVPGAVGKIGELEKIVEKYDGAIVAIGNSFLRQSLFESLKKAVTLVHPNAAVSKSAVIEAGCVIEAMSVVNCNARVERGSFICAGAIVNHNAVVGEFSQVDCNAVVACNAKVPSKMKVESCTEYRTPQKAVGEGSFF